MNKNKIILALLLMIFTFTSVTRADSIPGGLSFSGRIVKSDGTALESSSVAFHFSILSPGSEGCILYAETQFIDMSNSQGLFSATLGQGTVSVNPLGSLSKVFINSQPPINGLSCLSGNSYSPQSTHSRKLKVVFNDGSGDVTMSPDMVIDSSPYALHSEMLQGKQATDLVQINSSANVTQANVEQLLTGTGFSELLSLIGGTSTQYAKSNQLGGANLPTVNNGESIKWDSTLNAGAGGWATFSPGAALTVGTTAGTVAAGNDSRFTDSRPPTGSAGGDLTGNYPNPTINSGAVTTVKMFTNPGINRLVGTDTTTGTTLAPMICAIDQVLKWTVATGWQCTDVVLNSGKAGGQTIYGGTAASDNLILESTSSATKGYVLLNPNGGNVGIGTTSPASLLNVSGAPMASANMGLFSLGSGAWDGTANSFVGHASGTMAAINAASGYTGNLVDLQVAGSSKFKVSNTGIITAGGVISAPGLMVSSSYYINSSYVANQGGLNLQSFNNTAVGNIKAVAVGASTYSQSSGSNSIVAIVPTYSTSGTSANTDLLINRTESAVGSGAQKLIDAQVGGTTKFNVDNVGNGYFAGKVGIGTNSPQVTLDVNGGIRPGSSTVVTTCNASTEGSQRYNYTTHGMEFCNGTAWTIMQVSTCSQYSPTFTFSDLANQTASTLVTSDIIQITGINCLVPGTVSGSGSPQFQICSDSACTSVVQSWTAGPASIQNGQYVQIRQTTSGIGGITVRASMIIGGGAGVWSVSTAGSCAGLPGAPPPIGTVCADGTVYAGTDPDTSVPMYAMPCDLGMTWNGAVCTGTRSSFSWNNGTAGNAIVNTNAVAGKNNTAILVAAVDAGSPYSAANNCYSSTANGYAIGTWFLPSRDELNILYANLSSIGGFSTSSNYWSSTEYNVDQAWLQSFANGSQINNLKRYGNAVRCIRR